MLWRQILLSTIGISLLAVLNAQTDSKFTYELTEFGNYRVTRVGDQPVIEGKKGLAQILDQGYADGLIYGVIKTSIPVEKLRVDQLRAGYVITFRTSGEVVNVWFVFNEQDRELITEEELYNLYGGLMAIRFDTTKIRIIEGYGNTVMREQGYSFVLGLIQPAEHRKYAK